jgi:parallel beta-helix repeat protein
VNGKPVYYWKDVIGGRVPLGSGQVILANCQDVIVENQVLDDASISIELGLSSNNFIMNNSCNLNGFYGMYVDQSFDNTIVNNTFNQNIAMAIYFDTSYNNVIHKNRVDSNPEFGAYFTASYNNTITDNSFSSNNQQGVYVAWSSRNNTIMNNTCNNNLHGIHLEHGAYDNLITDNECSNNNNQGIFLTFSPKNIITNNTCILNGNQGINIFRSSHNTVINNSISGSNIGIYLHDSDLVNYNLIANNNCSDNDNGIYLYEASLNTISNNTCNSNTFYGIWVRTSSNQNNITNNTCNENDRDGIQLFDSAEGNIIKDNHVESNIQKGIYITSSNNNLIFHNNIIGNPIQAQDDGINNRWNETYPDGGNFGSDWTSPDNLKGSLQDQPGSDFIVDFAYPNIQGTAGAQDYYPYTLAYAWARVWNIDQDLWYTLIQDAINDANPGDRIWVRSDIYHETLVIDKTITLIGENRDTTIINGTGVGDVIYITADWVNITGFNITGSGPLELDAGIEMNNANFCRIQNNIVTGNVRGVNMDYCWENTFSNNTLYNNTHGFYLYNSPSSYFFDNTLFSCGFVIYAYQVDRWNGFTIDTTNTRCGTGDPCQL